MKKIVNLIKSNIILLVLPLFIIMIVLNVFYTAKVVDQNKLLREQNILLREQNIIQLGESIEFIETIKKLIEVNDFLLDNRFNKKELIPKMPEKKVENKKSEEFNL